MKRGHRRAHRALWPLLAGLIGVALVLALALRPPPQTEAENFTVLEILK